MHGAYGGALGISSAHSPLDSRGGPTPTRHLQRRPHHPGRPLALNGGGEASFATALSNIVVSGVPTLVGKVTATLKGISHDFPDDIDALLVGPSGQNLVLVSDAGNPGPNPPGANNVTLVLDDAASSQVAENAALGASGATVATRPVDYDPGGQVDAFPSPAPAPTDATTLSTFNGTNPNGTWRLFIVSDGAPETGTIAGGWCLDFTFDTAAPSVSVEQAGGQADPTSASPVTFTVSFSEAVTGFDADDVDLSASTAGGTLVAVVSGGPSTYSVAVSGMASDGAVVASVPAGAAVDASANASTASTSADNSVSYVAPDEDKDDEDNDKPGEDNDKGDGKTGEGRDKDGKEGGGGKLKGGGGDKA